jgi:hypothetical protein
VIITAYEKLKILRETEEMGNLVEARKFGVKVASGTGEIEVFSTNYLSLAYFL